MKVLQLPYNIASQISVNVHALREIGIEARGLVVNNGTIQDSANLECYKHASFYRHPFSEPINRLTWWHAVLKAIRWADVIHWHGSWALHNGYDVTYAARMGKAGIIEFWGSDIRRADIASADNPYCAEIYRLHPALHAEESQSHFHQVVFAKNGYPCAIPGHELEAYLDKSLFPTFYRCGIPLILSQYKPQFPALNIDRPLVIHLPSNKVKKGTDAVLGAVNMLQRTHSFDFRLVHGVKRSEAMSILRSCDILLDQFVLGDHGLASLEAMAFGKPVICYIKPTIMHKHPSDFPIVAASQHNLAEVLRDLLEACHRRHEIGKQSRAYVEKYHDSRLVAAQFVNIYEELLAKANYKQMR